MPHHLRLSILPQHNTRSLPVVQSSNSLHWRRRERALQGQADRAGKGQQEFTWGWGSQQTQRSRIQNSRGCVYHYKWFILAGLAAAKESVLRTERVHRQAGQPQSHYKAANAESEAEERSDQTDI